jgi:hypothetical protein
MIDLIQIAMALTKRAALEKWAAENFKPGFLLCYNDDELSITGPGFQFNLTGETPTEVLEVIFQVAARPGAFAASEPCQPAKNIYQEALAVQNACNSQAIIRSLTELLPAIVADAKGRGEDDTGSINRHPVIIAFLDKLMSLAWSQGNPAGAAACALATCAERAKV